MSDNVLMPDMTDMRELATTLDDSNIHGEPWSYGIPGLYFVDERWNDIAHFLEEPEAWSRKKDTTRDIIQKNVIILMQAIRFYHRLDKWRGWLYAVAMDLNWDYKTTHITFFSIMVARDNYLRKIGSDLEGHIPTARETSLLAEIDLWRNETVEIRDTWDVDSLLRMKINAARKQWRALLADTRKVHQLLKAYPSKTCLAGDDCGWPCHKPFLVSEPYVVGEHVSHLECEREGQRFVDLETLIYIGTDNKDYRIDMDGIIFDPDDQSDHGNVTDGFKEEGHYSKPPYPYYADSDEEGEEDSDDDVEEDEEDDGDEGHDNMIIDEDSEHGVKANFEGDAEEDGAIHEDDVKGKPQESGASYTSSHVLDNDEKSNGKGDNNIDSVHRDDSNHANLCELDAPTHFDRMLRSRSRSHSPTRGRTLPYRERPSIELPLRPAKL
jgi:hypothetical protein